MHSPPPNPSFQPGSRLVAYLRDSGGRDQNLSITQQEHAVGAWCREHSCLLTRVFKDVARSGTTTTGREQFLAMVAYLDEHTPERGLLLYELARFSRDYDDTMLYLSDLRRRGIVVHSITDPVPNTLDGRLMESILAWKNAKYSQDLQKQVKRGLHYVVAVHHASVGNAPMGYRNVQGEIGKRRDGTPHRISRLEVDERTAPLVQRAFELRSQGATLPEVHAQVGLYRWSVQYGKLFKNKIYLGIRTFGEAEIRDYCTPLIERSTWDAVQAVNQERASRFGYNHPRAVRSRFILTGLLHCSKCSHPMTGCVVKRGKYPQLDYYQCTLANNGVKQCHASLIPKKLVEQRTLLVLRERILVPEIVDEAYQRARGLLGEGDATRKAALQRAQDELAANNKAISRLVSAISDAGHSAALLETLETLETEKRETQERLAKLEVQAPAALPEEADLHALVQDARNMLDIMTHEDLGELLRTCILSISASKPKGQELTGTVTFHFPIPGLPQEIVVPL